MMTRELDKILTPQIKSEGVRYDKMTVLDGNVKVLTDASENHVSITEGKDVVSAVSQDAANIGLGYIRQLQVYFDGSVPVCEFDYFSPALKYRGFMIDVCRHFVPVDELKRIIGLMSDIGYNPYTSTLFTSDFYETLSDEGTSH